MILETIYRLFSRRKYIVVAKPKINREEWEKEKSRLLGNLISEGWSDEDLFRGE